MRIEFHMEENEEVTPIGVANALINSKTHLAAHQLFGIQYPEDDVDTFDIDNLEQIAEHLMVYCRHHREDRS